MKLKKILLIVIACVLTSDVYSQTISDVINNDNLNYYQKLNTINANDSAIYRTSNESEQKLFMRWQWFWQNRVDQTGLNNVYQTEIQGYEKQYEFNKNIDVWNNIGPINVEGNKKPKGIGRFESIWVSPNNPNFILG